ncbi:MAG: phosphatidate cytidylyltransferase [Clostridia bacterium]|nr:phosphatidate cytidylyltransferase [Clostridia bacterium]
MKWNKLKTRVISAVVLVALLLIVTFAPVSVFTFVLCAASFVVLHELMVTFNQNTKRSVVIANYIFAFFYMLSAFVLKETGNTLMYMITILFVMALLTLSVLNNDEIKFSDVCTSLFLVIYSVFFLMHLSFIRNMENGLAYVFLTFIGAWLTDTMAYFSGNLFGKHKLIEKVSPNKTVEGAVGGIVGAVVFFIIYGLVLSHIGYNVSFFRLVILSILCGIFAQLGDLSASVMKRAYSAKDFGNLIPGHGGLLDRIDSFIFVIPVVYYFVIYFPIL